MELIGIDPTFKQLIIACISAASVSALVEGSLIELVRLKKGLRQGDPLFPLLFVIVIEYLSRLVRQAVSSRKLELYTSGGVAVEIEPHRVCG